MALVVAPGTGEELYRMRSFCGVGIGRPQAGHLAVEWDPQFGAFVDASDRCISCEAVVLACTPVSAASSSGCEVVLGWPTGGTAAVTPP
jgi:hypothetical protein